MLRNLYYLILDDEKNPRSCTLYDKHWKKVNPSDLSRSSTLEDLGQHLPRADEPELEH